MNTFAKGCAGGAGGCLGALGMAGGLLLLGLIGPSMCAAVSDRIDARGGPSALSPDVFCPMALVEAERIRPALAAVRRAGLLPVSESASPAHPGRMTCVYTDRARVYAQITADQVCSAPFEPDCVRLVSVVIPGEAPWIAGDLSEASTR